MTISRNQIIAHEFDKAKAYDTASLVQKETAQRLAKLIIQKIGHHPPATILEIGCGTGYLTEELLGFYPDSRWIISDISPHMLKRTEQKLRQKNFSGTDIRFHLMDGETLTPPPPEKNFSLIISSLCIQWFTNRSTALENFVRILSPGGLICLTTLASGSFREWQNACKSASIPCGIPDYPTISLLNTDWPPGGKGAWFTQEIREKVPSARFFLRNLKKIGASLPRQDHKPATTSALKNAIALFDRRFHDISYQIAFGLFRKDFQCKE